VTAGRRRGSSAARRRARWLVAGEESVTGTHFQDVLERESRSDGPRTASGVGRRAGAASCARRWARARPRQPWPLPLAGPALGDHAGARPVKFVAGSIRMKLPVQAVCRLYNGRTRSAWPVGGDGHAGRSGSGTRPAIDFGRDDTRRLPSACTREAGYFRAARSSIHTISASKTILDGGAEGQGKGPEP